MMKAVIKKTKANELFSFSFVNNDGVTLVRSENYITKKSAINGVVSVKNNCINDKRYELKESKNGKFYFNIKAPNGQIVATSMLFATAEFRDIAIEIIKNEARQAEIVETEDIL